MIQSYTCVYTESQVFSAASTNIEWYEAPWAKEMVIIMRITASAGTNKLLTPTFEIAPHGIYSAQKTIVWRDSTGDPVTTMNANSTFYTDPIYGFGEIFRLVYAVAGTDSPQFTVTTYLVLKR